MSIDYLPSSYYLLSSIRRIWDIGDYVKQCKQLEARDDGRIPAPF
jgi:hypothetical protein